jgi:hypothetical protein
MTLIYYVLDASRRTQRVKIGITTNLDQRLVALRAQTMSRQLPIVLALEEGNRTIEADRHREFMAARLSGEWFRYAIPSPLADWVASLENPIAFLSDREHLWPDAGGWANTPSPAVTSLAELRTAQGIGPNGPATAGRRILVYLSEPDAEGRTGVIAARLSIPIGTVGSALRVLSDSGRVVQTSYGEWALVVQEQEEWETA